jgi:hypothetical protein
MRRYWRMASDPWSRALPIVALALGCGVAAQGVQARAKPNADLATAVARGCQTYAARLQRDLHTLRGEWLVDSTRAKPSPDTAEKPMAQRRLLRSRRSYRLQAVVDGEAWREFSETISASGDEFEAGDQTVRGFDGSTTVSGKRARGGGAWQIRTWPGNMGDTVWNQEVGFLTGVALLQSQDLSPATVAGMTVSEAKLGGHKCYVLTREERSDDPVLTVQKTWICPDFGYAVVRVESLLERSSRSSWGNVAGRIRWELSNFRQFGEGLWLPLGYSGKSEEKPPGGDWRVTAYRKARATKLQVNIPIAKKELQVSDD